METRGKTGGQVAAIGRDNIPIDGMTTVVKEHTGGTVESLTPPDMDREKKIEVLRFRVADDERRMGRLSQDIAKLDKAMVSQIERLNMMQEQRGEMAKHLGRFKVWHEVTVAELNRLGASP
jgi:hypothetical protein